MTRPQTCGVAGGAISFWINITDCSSGFDGIISSYEAGAGASIYCVEGNIGYSHFLIPFCHNALSWVRRTYG